VLNINDFRLVPRSPVLHCDGHKTDLRTARVVSLRNDVKCDSIPASRRYQAMYKTSTNEVGRFKLGPSNGVAKSGRSDWSPSKTWMANTQHNPYVWNEKLGLGRDRTKTASTRYLACYQVNIAANNYCITPIFYIHFSAVQQQAMQTIHIHSPIYKTSDDYNNAAIYYKFPCVLQTLVKHAESRVAFGV
jgi:hypothetical protein